MVQLYSLPQVSTCGFLCTDIDYCHFWCTHFLLYLQIKLPRSSCQTVGLFKTCIKVQYNNYTGVLLQKYENHHSKSNIISLNSSSYGGQEYKIFSNAVLCRCFFCAVLIKTITSEKSNCSFFKSQWDLIE